MESIYAWQLHSRHEVIVLNLWPGGGAYLSLPESLSLSEYDAVVVHPTASYFAHNLANLDRHLSRRFADYDGVKVLMKQDEQVNSASFANIIREKGFDIVLTCLPPAEQEKVYPRAIIGDCELIQMLTGYVSPAMREGYSRERRDIDVSYRGSIQPLEFGRLGYEKRGIGYDVARALGDRGLRADISSRWEDRIVGSEWSKFLSRSRVVLGVESGANLFDFTGEVAEWCRGYEARTSGQDRASESYYLAAHREFLHAFEGNVNYAQISPRHFEAAAAGAAQLLYEGLYSDIFHANEHFMPLRRDLGNLAEAIDFLRDDALQARMVERTFEEVILKPTNWYEGFVAEADSAIERRALAKGLSSFRQRSRNSDSATRPVAYVLAAHDPVLDPRITWVATSLMKTHEVYVIGTYNFGEVGDGPYREVNSEGMTIVRVERTKHDAAWLPSLAQLRASPSIARGMLATLAGYASLPEKILADRIGAYGDTSRFRELCAYFVNTNSALLEAMQKMGPPDLIVAADLETLPAATVVAGDVGSFCIFDAHEYWPYSYTDFQFWEIEFWIGLERQLSQLANLRVTVSPQFADIMTAEYQCEFLTLPNCARLCESEGLDLENAYARRATQGLLKIAFLGGFAEGRGIEETLHAFVHVKSAAKLILRGRDNPYRHKLIKLARSLGLGEDRVSFPPAVPESELIRTAAEADVGLIPYNPAYYVYRYCCPNKLSQYAAAGLPILSSRTEYVAGIVRREGIGRVVDISDPVNFAAVIDELSEDRSALIELGRRARQFFEKTYHWENMISPVLQKVEHSVESRMRRTSYVDLDWIASAQERRKRHGAVVAVSPALFGAHATSLAPSGTPVLTKRHDPRFVLSRLRSNRAARKVWHSLPSSMRYGLSAWLQRVL
ncbi:glycosyltransferase [Bradyrhizobium sp. sBnM-33]|uniref:glycosyltransferase family protein n=1 Tax=Bradyrhizobium sp. sBnM-33 TaxID=2831780 RepID=UPI001BD098BB|nr:glycosyltransferase [Bradyrhizobium sp. sBnM-33]